MAKFSEYVQRFEEDASAEERADLRAFRSHHRIARQLREARKSKGLTQVELAALIGVDQAEVSRVERGEANPTEATLHRFAAALDVELQIVPVTAAASEIAPA